MTDQKSKPAWTRCPRCKWRIFNDPIDKSVHDQRCPADLEKNLAALSRKLDELEKTLDGLGEQVSAEPALDLDDVAPWEDDDIEGEGIDDPAEDVGVVGSAANYYNDVEDEYPPALPR